MLSRVPDDLLAAVDVDGDCWLWRVVTTSGYGSWRGGFAHRRAYELFVGPIPARRQVHHSCGRKACVNPAHLELVNGREHARRHLKTHCKHGHALTPVNVYLVRYPYGVYRACATCSKRAQKRYAARLARRTNKV
jgi:hypothetical protein